MALHMAIHLQLHRRTKSRDGLYQTSYEHRGVTTCNPTGRLTVVYQWYTEGSSHLLQAAILSLHTSSSHYKHRYVVMYVYQFCINQVLHIIFTSFAPWWFSIVTYTSNKVWKDLQNCTKLSPSNWWIDDGKLSYLLSTTVNCYQQTVQQ